MGAGVPTPGALPGPRGRQPSRMRAFSTVSLSLAVFHITMLSDECAGAASCVTGAPRTEDVDGDFILLTPFNTMPRSECESACQSFLAAPRTEDGDRRPQDAFERASGVLRLPLESAACTRSSLVDDRERASRNLAALRTDRAQAGQLQPLAPHGVGSSHAL